MTTTQASKIEEHGRNLLAVFPDATERDPVKLCKRLRRLEGEAAKIALRLCNGPEYPEGKADELLGKILGKVNALLGNVRHEYQPKTGQRCTCKRGVERDNCAACEGTGLCIDFAAIRGRHKPARDLVPIFINRDPRGYALKVNDEWQREQKKAGKPYIGHEDWGGYGIIAPEIK